MSVLILHTSQYGPKLKNTMGGMFHTEYVIVSYQLSNISHLFRETRAEKAGCTSSPLRPDGRPPEKVSILADISL